MPVLHRYKDKQNYYILTSIEGNIITFQLTPDGLKRILDAGIKPEEKFGRALLLDLCRAGEAFTHGTGPGEATELSIDSRQTEFDFSNDPDSEKMFPSCSDCKSMTDLHLVEIKDKYHVASILCGECRSKNIASFDTSIPLALVSRTILNRLIIMKEIVKFDSSVRIFKELLDAEFESKWDAYRKGVPEQGVLDVESGNQGKLI